MQSNKTRVAVLAAAAAAAVLLFVILSGDEEEQGAPPTSAEASRPSDRGSAGGGQRSGEEAKGGRLPTITVTGGQPQGGVQELSAQSGEQVRFRVVSDGRAEVHVHGYEIEKEVTPDEPAVFGFPAEIEGGFEIELHLPGGSEVEIAELEVTPS
jgi:FtsP/CotA-like multicopper oxidase with cupredoxin domain